MSMLKVNTSKLKPEQIAMANSANYVLRKIENCTSIIKRTSLNLDDRNIADSFIETYLWASDTHLKEPVYKLQELAKILDNYVIEGYNKTESANVDYSKYFIK